METPEFQELLGVLTTLDMRLVQLRAYTSALEFAILYHCSGKTIPDDIAEIIPQYAKYLNKSGCCQLPADDELLNIISQGIIERKN